MLIEHQMSIRSLQLSYCPPKVECKGLKKKITRPNRIRTTRLFFSVRRSSTKLFFSFFLFFSSIDGDGLEGMVFEDDPSRSRWVESRVIRACLISLPSIFARRMSSIHSLRPSYHSWNLSRTRGSTYKRPRGVTTRNTRNGWVSKRNVSARRSSRWVNRFDISLFFSF